MAGRFSAWSQQCPIRGNGQETGLRMQKATLLETFEHTQTVVLESTSWVSVAHATLHRFPIRDCQSRVDSELGVLE